MILVKVMVVLRILMAFYGAPNADNACWIVPADNSAACVVELNDKFLEVRGSAAGDIEIVEVPPAW